MGIEPFLVATSVNLIAASGSCGASARTARRNWNCRRQALIDAGYTPEEVKTVKISRQGLHDVHKGGYKGRTGFVRSDGD